MLDRIEFLAGEALIALRRNNLMTFAAVTTVAVSLFLLGGLGYVYFRVARYAQTIPGKFEMRVFLREGTNLDDIQRTAREIRAMEGVGIVNWIPRDKAWQREKDLRPEMTEGLENPLPDAFKVTVTDLGRSDEIAARIRQLDRVEPEGGVAYLKEEQQFIDQGLKVVRWLGTVLGGLLFLTGGILIYNAIRLTVLSRRLEIRIMQLVGASRATVQIPFLIEGTLQGVVGGTMASFMIYASELVFQQFLRSLNESSRLEGFPMGAGVVVLGLVGAVYGLVCSAIAVRAPLKYR